MNERAKSGSTSEGPSLPAVVALALLTGLLCGLGFGLRDGISVLETYTSGTPPGTWSEILSFIVYSMFSHGIVGGVLMAVIGLAIVGYPDCLPEDNIESCSASMRPRRWKAAPLWRDEMAAWFLWEVSVSGH